MRGRFRAAPQGCDPAQQVPLPASWPWHVPDRRIGRVLPAAVLRPQAYRTGAFGRLRCRKCRAQARKARPARHARRPARQSRQAAVRIRRAARSVWTQTAGRPQSHRRYVPWVLPLAGMRRRIRQKGRSFPVRRPPHRCAPLLREPERRRDIRWARYRRSRKATAAARGWAHDRQGRRMRYRPRHRPRLRPDHRPRDRALLRRALRWRRSGALPLQRHRPS